MSPAQQRAFGEMALVTLLAWESREGRGVARLSPQVKERWGHAVVAIWNRIAMLIPDPAKYPEGPDLAALGIRACRVCGCVEESACNRNRSSGSPRTSAARVARLTMGPARSRRGQG